MRKIKHSSTVTTRPGRKTTGTYGYFTDKDSTTNTPGTVVMADFLNDIQDELTTLVTDPTGGNTALSDNTDQVLTAVKTIVNAAIAAIPKPTAVINTIVHSTNNPTVQQFTYNVAGGNAISISSGNSASVTQKVFLSGTPSGATGVILRARLNTDYGGDAKRVLAFRKNNTESFADKILVDPYYAVAIESITGNGGFSETDNYATFLLDFQTSDNSFEYQFRFNDSNIAFNGTVLECLIDIWVEGWIVPKTVVLA